MSKSQNTPKGRHFEHPGYAKQHSKMHHLSLTLNRWFSTTTQPITKSLTPNHIYISRASTFNYFCVDATSMDRRTAVKHIWSIIVVRRPLKTHCVRMCVADTLAIPIPCYTFIHHVFSMCSSTTCQWIVNVVSTIRRWIIPRYYI